MDGGTTPPSEHYFYLFVFLVNQIKILDPNVV
jgi:hypothetical protein